jgi:hypothetical protein
MRSKSIHGSTKSKTNFANPKIVRIRAQKCQAPQLNDPITNKQGKIVSPDCAGNNSALPMESSGIADLIALVGLPIDKDTFHFILSLLKDRKPKDPIEAMLLAQMSVVHKAAMRHGQRLTNADNIVEQGIEGNLFIKLARTFVSEMEAFDRHQTGGEQKATGPHVSVSGGSQAIVGNITQAPREAAPNETVASPPHSRTAKPANDDLDEAARTPVTPKREASK